MVRSMTGFGRCYLEEEDWTQVWEIRSVNGRHMDIRWRLPGRVRALEAALEKQVKAKAARGRIEVSLFLEMHGQGDNESTLNTARAEAMLDSLESFAASRGQEFYPDYGRLLGLSSLWDEALPEADEALHESLSRGLDMALDDWNESRAGEGATIEKDLKTRILRIEEWLRSISERAPDIKEERFAQVRERLNEVLERHGLELEEGRFLQEITLLADKLDVSEELTRLAAHLDRLREILAAGKDAGRKLDFTLQECFREITTCGNKIQDVQVSRLVVDMKNEMEKCREQVQNVE